MYCRLEEIRTQYQLERNWPKNPQKMSDINVFYWAKASKSFWTGYLEKSQKTCQVAKSITKEPEKKL